MLKMTKWKAALYDWRQRRIMNAAVDPLANLPLTTDTGLRPDQTARFAEVFPSGVEEFDGMLACVGLDTNAVPLKATMRVDLYLNCADCSRHQACKQWLTANKNDDEYKRFCPNAWVFDRFLRRDHWRGLGAS